MSPMVRTFAPDLTYLEWHRPASITRYLDDQEADSLFMIDVDSLESCHKCKEPLALIETARDTGRDDKATTALRKLAKRANLPAFLVYYTIGDDDISKFRTKQVAPTWGDWRTLTPAEYAQWLLSLRATHECEET